MKTQMNTLFFKKKKNARNEELVWIRCGFVFYFYFYYFKNKNKNKAFGLVSRTPKKTKKKNSMWFGCIQKTNTPKARNLIRFWCQMNTRGKRREKAERARESERRSASLPHSD